MADLKSAATAMAKAGIALPDATLPVIATDAKALEDALVSANGLTLGRLEPVSIQFISADKFAVVHEGFVVKDKTLPRGLKAGDKNLGALKFLVHHEAWAPRTDKDSPTLDELLYLDLGAIILTAALNVAVGAHPLEGLMIAVAFALGLYNHGLDALPREWHATDKNPPEAAVLAMMNSFVGGLQVAYIALCMDLLSFLGYTRINSTHTHLSSDQSMIKRHHDLIMKAVVRRLGDKHGLTIAEADVARFMHGRLHGASLHGAVGFCLYWTRTAYASEVIRIRCTPVGDAWKGAIIGVAGYEALVSHPVIAIILRALTPDLVWVKGMLAALEAMPWRSSSLSKVFCKEPAHIMDERVVAYVQLMAALIAAAAEQEILPKSFRDAYFIKNFVSKKGGVVEFWKSYLGGITQRVGRMTDAEIRAAVTASRQQAIEDDPKAGAAAGARAAQV